MLMQLLNAEPTNAFGLFGGVVRRVTAVARLGRLMS